MGDTFSNIVNRPETPQQRQSRITRIIVDKLYGDPDETETQRNERVFYALKNYYESMPEVPYSDEALAIKEDIRAILMGEE